MDLKNIFKSVNIADIVLFLLLLFAENWARSVFPSHLELSSAEPIEPFSSQAFIAILIGGITGVVAFFFRPLGSDVKPESFMAKVSAAIGVFGTFVMAVVVSFMFMFFLLIVSAVFLPDEGDSFIMVMLAGILFAMAFPFVLAIRYFKKFDTLRVMDPTLRYLMFLPAIFLATAMMNANALDIISDDSGSWYTKFFSFVFNFFVLYLGPRIFATGRQIEWKGSPGWIINIGLYFGTSYIGSGTTL